MRVRLQKVLAGAGVASRRDAEEWIRAGRVVVNGSVVSELGTKVDPDLDTISVDGRSIETRVSKLYLLLYKPKGFVSTRGDPHASHTVIDLVRPALEARMGRGHAAIEGLHPVGRLDADSEGLLLLTNDGDFTFALTHPRHEVPKVYEAVVRGKPSRDVLQQLRAGIEIEGRRTAPAQARLLEFDARQGTARVELTLHEGRKRQVREMLKRVGHPVISLIRVRLGQLTVSGMKPGQWRPLAPREVERLRAMAAEKSPEAMPHDPLPSPVPAANRPARPRLAGRSRPSAATTERSPGGKGKTH
jgi:pseudouridine synthase